MGYQSLGSLKKILIIKPKPCRLGFVFMKPLVLHILLLSCIQSAFGQTPYSSWEMGAFGGESYYLGELNQQHFTTFNPAFGPFIRYNYDQRLSVRTGLTIGTLSGDDEKSNNSFNNARNFSFVNQIIEASVIGEFNFFSFSALDAKSYVVTPYFFLGLAYANHNPKAEFNGIQISTVGLASEGNQYKRHLFTLPMGMGIKWRLNRFGLGIQWGIRKTYTDYLDDVSTNFLAQGNSTSSSQVQIANTTAFDNVDNKKRGDDNNTDWYVFTGVSLFVNLTPKQVCRTF